MSGLFKHFLIVLFIPVLPSSAQDDASFDSIPESFLNQDFLDAVDSVKSTYALRASDVFLLGFELETKSPLQCTLRGYGKHEGGIEMDFHYDPAEGSWQTNSSNAYHCQLFRQSSTALLLVEMQHNDSIHFKRYPNIDFALRRVLLAGAYSNSFGDTVLFENDGSVFGFGENARYFEIIYDFGLGIEFDAICIFPTEKGGNRSDAVLYHYQIKAGQVILYEIESDWEQLEHTITAEPITLTKID